MTLKKSTAKCEFVSFYQSGCSVFDWNFWVEIKKHANLCDDNNNHLSKRWPFWVPLLSKFITENYIPIKEKTLRNIAYSTTYFMATNYELCRIICDIIVSPNHTKHFWRRIFWALPSSYEPLTILILFAKDKEFFDEIFTLHCLTARLAVIERLSFMNDQYLKRYWSDFWNKQSNKNLL